MTLEQADKAAPSAVATRLWWVLAVLILPVTLVVNTAVFLYRGGTDMDQAVFGYVGRQWLAGQPPYAGAWDHKGPLTYISYTLGAMLDRTALYGPLVLNAVHLCVAYFLLYRLLRRFFSEPATIGALAVSLVGLSIKTYTRGGFTEDLALPFVALAIWAGVESLHATTSQRRFVLSALSGVAISALFLYRPNLIGPALGVYLYFLIGPLPDATTPRRLSLVAVNGVATVGGIALCLLMIRIGGIWPQFWDAFWVYNRTYAEVTMADRLRALVSLLKGRPLITGAAIAGIAAGFLGSRLKEDRAFTLSVTAGFGASVLLSALSGRDYPHYATSFIPYMAIFVAIVFNRLEAQFWGPMLSRASAVLAALILVAVCGNNLLRARQPFPGGLADAAVLSARVRAYVDQRIEPGDSMYVWNGPPSAYLLSGGVSPSRFFYNLPILTTGYQTADLDQFIGDLKRTPPKLILDCAESWLGKGGSSLIPEMTGSDAPVQPMYARDLRKLRAFILANYEVDERIDGVVMLVPRQSAAASNGGG